MQHRIARLRSAKANLIMQKTQHENLISRSIKRKEVELLRAVNVQEQEIALQDNNALSQSQRIHLNDFNIIEEEGVSMGFGSFSQRGESLIVLDQEPDYEQANNTGHRRPVSRR